MPDTGSQRYFMVEVNIVDQSTAFDEASRALTWGAAREIAAKVNVIEGAHAVVDYKHDDGTLPYWPDEERLIEHLPHPCDAVVIVNAAAGAIAAAAAVAGAAWRIYWDSHRTQRGSTRSRFWLRHSKELIDLDAQKLTKEDFEVLFEDEVGEA